MGGFFGAVANKDVVFDIFYGVDYHSHLGTSSAGMAVWSKENGFKRDIHSISNTPFRTKFEKSLSSLQGTAGIGCISDTDPEPLIVRSHLGVFAIGTVGKICNAKEITDEYLKAHEGQLMTMSSGNVNSTELVAALINEKQNLVDGIRNAQDKIDGSITIIMLTEQGEIIAARDKKGRLPVVIGQNENGYCVTLENFAADKLGYYNLHELGPAEIVKVKADGLEVLAEAGKDMKICAFMWTYYGYPSTDYEGVNVEVMRYRNGEIMARDEAASEDGIPDVDYVAGVPDSGLAHAIGYANVSGKSYARPFVKYTPTWPRSFMPNNQNERSQVAKMKQLAVKELINGKKLMFLDDSIVRGTQLQNTVDYLYGAGAAEVHMRSGCPPIMYGCKYLNFSRSNSEMELIARRTIQELEGNEGQKHLEEYSDVNTKRGKCLVNTIAEQLGFTSLRYQSLDGLLKSIGLDRDKICTYCWNGKE